MRVTKQYTNNALSQSTTGFTLLELIIIVSLIGVVSAIAAPAWSGFVNRQRLNTSQNYVYQAMHDAKSNATRDKITWQVSFRQITSKGNQVVQWSIHQAEDSQFIPNSVMRNNSLWHDLEPNILIDQSKNKKGKYETSLTKQTSTGPWRVQFNYQGCPVRKPSDECGRTALTALGRLTLRSKNGGKLRRCVIVSTILGAMRAGKEHSKPDSSDKYCY